MQIFCQYSGMKQASPKFTDPRSINISLIDGSRF
nr:unnamed protein product [Callosobruchus chinensis]